jgi:beta-phosphoglucomutase family hydrolase
MSADPAAGSGSGAGGPMAAAPDSAEPAGRRLRPDLASRCSAWLFDLDGVITDTARIHAEAWRQMFDEFLRDHAARTGVAFRPFDQVRDYEAYVDGKPRYDGVRDFLAARSVDLPDGTPGDAPDLETVCGLGNRKNVLVGEFLRRDGVAVFAAVPEVLRAVRAAGARTAVVSASENCATVLAAAGLADAFDVQVDGRVAVRERLPGKPAPATYLHAARMLGVGPDVAAVVEDAPAGVAAGRAGRFGLVIGVARRATRGQLRDAGADVVITDMGELLDPSPPVGY